MPTNRNKRARKSEAPDSMKISELHYGPGTCLLAGCGYYLPGSHKFYWQLDDAEKADVVSWMRDDWLRYHSEVMAAWKARDAHDQYIARDHHGDPTEPWALTEFGEPR